MQTSFTPAFLQTADGQRVNQILRNCVHCGFCNATCPTYAITGDELDGPRGRIYLIKNFFEGHDASRISMQHLDRCLTCLACETTCPSGVEYGDLVDIGRKHFETAIKRPNISKLKRSLIVNIFSNAALLAIFFTLARLCKPLLPASIARKIPHRPSLVKIGLPLATGARKMLTIKGCVQSVAAPQINAAARKVLQRTNIQFDEAATQCCGALAFHLTDMEKAHKTIRKNIDVWYTKLEKSHEYLVVASSGCSSFIKQYSTIMQADSYAEKARVVSARCKDLAEISTDLQPQSLHSRHKTVAFHSPCTLQHGQKIIGAVEHKLQKAGYTLVEVHDAHLCCGSAGAYSLLETKFSGTLLQNKVNSLQEKQPDIIATANIGCLLHLQSGSQTPVRHWIELLAQE